MLVGALAGLLYFIFSRTFAEPVIQRAIDYESGRDDARAALDKAAGLPPESMGPEIFSRTIQSDVGIAFGLILFGVAMGAPFAVIYAVTVTRIGNISPRNLALLLAGGLFLGIYLVPFVKYPANPPSVGHSDDRRPHRPVTGDGGLFPAVRPGRSLAGSAPGAAVRQLDGCWQLGRSSS